MSRPDPYCTHVVTDPTAGMFAVVKGDVLTDKNAHLAPTRYTDWLS
ncbi:hypothetical protein ABT088_37925 [Streptomyces mirabilis]|nr:hypothetical protein [Streptomyces sp. AK02-04a]MDX3757723.1 hypothetical protein [Streptomyces sp. AK02-04a]